MKRPPPGFLTTPTGPASLLVSISVLALPSNCRDRYRDEFRAELCYLPIGRQIPEAAGLLAGAVALRHALKEADVSISAEPVRHLTCRIGRHHYLFIDDQNPEDRRIHHFECRDCGKVKEQGPDYRPTDGSWLTKGSLGGW